MDKKNTQKNIEIMQAFVDGREIEVLVYCPDYTTRWEKEPSPNWNWDEELYRVAPINTDDV